MSEGQDSSTKEALVYVRLLNEGTSVFRPVTGERLGPFAARLLSPDDFDASDEEWEFAPGSVVRCESKVLEGIAVEVAVSLYDE